MKKGESYVITLPKGHERAYHATITCYMPGEGYPEIDIKWTCNRDHEHKYKFIAGLCIKLLGEK